MSRDVALGVARAAELMDSERRERATVVSTLVSGRSRGDQAAGR